LKSWKGVNSQVLVELIQAGCKTLHFEVHKMINSGWNKKELSQHWMEDTIVHVYKKGGSNY
jgi:hypothetical protein